MKWASENNKLKIGLRETGYLCSVPSSKNNMPNPVNVLIQFGPGWGKKDAKIKHLVIFLFLTEVKRLGYGKKDKD